MLSPDPFWEAVERVGSLKDVHIGWQGTFGATMPRLQPYLRMTADPAHQYPCLSPCGQKCAMHVISEREGYLAFCPDNPPQADPVDLSHEDVVAWELDIASLARDIAGTLGFQCHIKPNPVAHNAWEIGSVILQPGKSIPVCFALPLGLRNYEGVAKSLLARGRTEHALLVPGICDAEARLLIEDNDGQVIPMASFDFPRADADPGTGKSLQSILVAKFGDPVPAYAFRLLGEMWQVRWDGGEPGYYRDSKGMRYYAHLLENPRKPYIAYDLQKNFLPAKRDVEPSRGIDKAGDIDKDELEQQCDALFGEIEEARDKNDPAEVERLEKEMRALLECLSTDYDKYGRSRKADDPYEQARKNVDGVLRTAREKLKKGNPEIARHLDADVNGSTALMYNPSSNIHWNI